MYGGVKTYVGYKDIWGCMDFGSIWIYRVYRHMGVYGHMKSIQMYMPTKYN